jgi:hypothetical protein
LTQYQQSQNNMQTIINHHSPFAQNETSPD